MADSLAFVQAILRATAPSEKVAASFYDLIGVTSRTLPRLPAADERHSLAAEKRAQLRLLTVHLAVSDPGTPLPRHNDATGAFRRVARWLRSRPLQAFGSWRRKGGRAEMVIEVSIISEQHGPVDYLPQEVVVPSDFLGACAAANLPVVLGAFASR